MSNENQIHILTLFDGDYKVAVISTFYLTVTRIIMPSFNRFRYTEIYNNKKSYLLLKDVQTDLTQQVKIICL